MNNMVKQLKIIKIISFLIKIKIIRILIPSKISNKKIKNKIDKFSIINIQIIKSSMTKIII